MIAINAVFLATAEPDGIPRSTYWLTIELLKQNPAQQFALLTPAIRWSAAAEHLASYSNCSIVAAGGFTSRLGRLFWQLALLPVLAWWVSASVLFNPYGNGPPFLLGRISLVLTLHDVSWLESPSYYSGAYRAGKSLLVRRALRIASKVLTISNFSAAEIHDHLAVKRDRIAVAYNGINPDLLVNASHVNGSTGRVAFDEPSRDPLFLFVGSLTPRKNLPRIVEAFIRFQTDVPSAHLAIIGAGTGFARRIELPMHPNVHCLGYVDDGELAALYVRAVCLVAPYLYEGFGLPVLEAMCLGVPVMTSLTTGVGEVAGDAALLVDPNSVEQICEGLRRIWNEQSLRDSLRERGLKRAALFTWEAAARRVGHLLLEEAKACWG